MNYQKQKIRPCFVVLILVLVGLVFVYARVQAAEPGDRAVLSNDGTIHLIRDNVRRPFPSASVYFSHGFEFSDAVPASSADLVLSEGVAVSYAEGTLVKGSSATVYLVSEGMRRAFSSGDVFLGLGYSFDNVLVDESGLLDSVAVGAVISSANTAHPAGALVNNAGTIFLVTPTGRQGIPTLNDFNSYRYDFSDVVVANAQDLALSDEGLIGQESASSETSETPVVQEPETPAPSPEPESVVVTSPSAPIKDGVIAAFPKRLMTFGFTSTDPDGDSISYSVDWGDGTPKSTAVKASGVKFTTPHDWTFIGDYIITVTADDGTGNITTSEFPMKVGLDPTEFGPAVSVISPNGGEAIAIGTVYTIQWKWNWIPLNTDEEVTIFFRRSGANQEITADEDDQTYSWVVTGDGIVVADNYKITILSEGTPGTGVIFDDSSDSTFSLK